MGNSPYSKDNVRSGAWHYLLGRGAAGLAGFATVVLLVRYMDMQGYAAFTALSGLISFVGILASLGMERTLSRYIPEARLERSAKDLASLIWKTALVRFAVTLLIALLLGTFWSSFLSIFKDIQIPFFPKALLCFIVAETLFQHFSSVFQALVLQKTLTKILIVQWAGRLAAIFIALVGDHYISLDESLWIMAVPEFFGVIVFIVVLLMHLNSLENNNQNTIKSSAHTQASWPDWQVIIQTARNNYGYLLLAAPPQPYFIKMVAAFFLSAEYVAAYGFFVSIAERIRQYIPLHFFYNLIEPVIVANYIQNRNFESLSYRCQLLYKSNLILMVPAIAWIAVCGDSTVSLITDGKFQGLSWILVLVMVQLTIGSHVVLLQLILNSIEKSQFLVYASTCALSVMMTLMLATVPFYPKWLLVGSTVFSMVMNLYIIHKIKQLNYNYQPSWRMLRGVLLSGLLAFMVTYLGLLKFSTHLSNIGISMISFISIMAVYSVALWKLNSITRAEIDLVKSALVKA